MPVFAFLNVLEVVVIGLVFLLLFGTRIPGLMRSLAQGVVEFKKGVQGIDEEPPAPNSRKP